jgi:hypothetical protein
VKELILKGLNMNNPKKQVIQGASTNNEKRIGQPCTANEKAD